MVAKKVTDKQIEEALIRNKGLVYISAKELGISHPTIIHRIKVNPHLAELREGLQELELDKAELNLYRACNAEPIKGFFKNNLTAIIFFLKTKGRKRGYDQNEIGENNLAYVKEFIENIRFVKKT